MLNTRSEPKFDEILEEIIGEPTIETHATYNMEWSSTVDPMHLSYILGNLDITPTSITTPHKNPYSKYKKIIIRPAHALTASAQIAFELINSVLATAKPTAVTLPTNFTLVELKRCYKKAALLAHPDCGGTHERFLDLKSSYEMLLAFLSAIK